MATQILKRNATSSQDLNLSYMLEQKAKTEMFETGHVQTVCPKCKTIPSVKVEGLYGETVSVRCKCGFLYCVERGI